MFLGLLKQLGWWPWAYLAKALTINPIQGSDYSFILFYFFFHLVSFVWMLDGDQNWQLSICGEFGWGSIISMIHDFNCRHVLLTIWLSTMIRKGLSCTIDFSHQIPILQLRNISPYLPRTIQMELIAELGLTSLVPRCLYVYGDMLYFPLCVLTI